MGRALIIDTNVLIDYERGVLDRTEFDDDDLVIAAITVAEFRTGIELAPNAAVAAARTRALSAVLSAIDVLEYTQETAVVHARLIAATRRAGRPRGAHDAIIAAHAVQTGRTIVSRDAAARFGDLPGVVADTPRASSSGTR